MNHKDTLNTLIANSCIARTSKDKTTNLYIIDLHCETMWMISTNTNIKYEYEIIWMEMQGNKSDSEMNGLVNAVYNDWGN